MKAFVFQRQLLLLSALVVVPVVFFAQQASSSESFSQADSELTSDYKIALRRFTPANQEALRRAERAWIEFTNKQYALFHALKRENILTQDAVDKAAFTEICSRRDHLLTFFVTGNPILSVPLTEWQSRDRELTSAYGDCMSRLSGSNQLLLKEAERAWITYRDADAISSAVAYNNQGAQITAAAQLTAIRTAQLVALVNAAGQAATNVPVQESAPQNSSPDPDDLKSAAQLQEDAKAMLKSFVVKKDDPFFKKADVLQNIPELSHELADSVSKLDAKFTELSQKPFSANFLGPALNEQAAIQLLAAWSKFLQLLKTESVDDAGGIIHDALARKPKEVSADYLPLWQTVISWQDVYLQEEPKFREHIHKARELADLGKTSDAIKEYQAAYTIIEDSTIPAKIKKLREQSLGL